VVPSDQVGHKVAKALINAGPARDRLVAGSYVQRTEDDPIGAIELALEATVAAEPIDAIIREAEKAGRFDDNPKANVRDLAVVAHELGVIDAAQFEILRRRDHLRDIVIRVDDFPFDFGVASALKPPTERKAA
jgi:acyl-CoA dehydrogenase